MFYWEAVMKIKATFKASICLLLLTTPVFAGPPADAGVTRIQVEGVDDLAASNPISPGTVTCPGGTLTIDETTFLPVCTDSNTNRLHIRDSVFWSCMSAVDEPRMTGVGLFTVNANFDADFSGAVWGKWTLFRMDRCDKDGEFPEAGVMNATESWHGTWKGQRLFYSDLGFPVWIGDLDIVGKGSGGTVEGLHFKGKEFLTTYTPIPLPYELIPGLDATVAEGMFFGTIKE
jgi:hypothetical protein